MKTLSMIAFAIAGLSITTEVQAQTAPMTLAELNRLNQSYAPVTTSETPATGMTEARCQELRGEWRPHSQSGSYLCWGYHRYVDVNYNECIDDGGEWRLGERRTREMCWRPMALDGSFYTPWSPSAQAREETVQYASYGYTAAIAIPEGVPHTMCEYPAQAQGCESGESWYERTVRMNPGRERIALFNGITRMHTGCVGLVEPEEPREERDVRSDSGFSYRDRGGPFTVYHRYSDRYRARPETESERAVARAERHYVAASGVCEGFLEQYAASNGFRSVF